jgi:hypothetical protein
MSKRDDSPASNGFRWVDKETGERCETFLNRLCTSTDPAHRHVAEHMWRAPVSALGDES